MGAGADLGASRFPSPLIKPDVRISRIRLSDWLHRRLTNEVPTVPDGVGALPTPRKQRCQSTAWCRATTLCDASEGNAVRDPQRNDRPPDKPASGFHS